MKNGANKKQYEKPVVEKQQVILENVIAASLAIDNHGTRFEEEWNDGGEIEGDITLG